MHLLSAFGKNSCIPKHCRDASHSHAPSISSSADDSLVYFDASSGSSLSASAAVVRGALALSGALGEPLPVSTVTLGFLHLASGYEFPKSTSVLLLTEALLLAWCTSSVSRRYSLKPLGMIEDHIGPSHGAATELRRTGFQVAEEPILLTSLQCIRRWPFDRPPSFMSEEHRVAASDNFLV